MGGVVDVKTRDDFAEDGKLIWGSDILDSQLFYEGKVGKKKKHGLAIGARRSYIDLLLAPLLGNAGFTIKPRYWDYQVKWVPELENDQSFSTFVYGFDDVLLLSTPDDFAQGADQDTQGDFRTKYNSHRVLSRYQKQLSDSVHLDITPSLGVDTAYLGLGQEFALSNSLYLMELRVQTPWEVNEHLTVVPGMDVFGGWWGFEFQSAIRITDIDDPLAERESIGFDGQGQIWSPDLFLKANIRPLHDTDKWLITPGLRMNNVFLTVNGEITGEADVPPDYSLSIDPRLLSRYAFTDAFAVKGSVGLYHQPPQGNEAIGVGSEADVAHEQAATGSIGWEHKLTNAVHYDVDLFYKNMSDLILYDEAWTGFGSQPFFNGGDGRAYGLEVIARHEPVGNFFGWVSYTLSRAVRRDPPYCDEADDVTGFQLLAGTSDCFYQFDFDQTHIFSAQGGYDLPYDFGVSAQVQYVTGNPSDPLNAAIYDADGDFYNGFPTGDNNSSRLPPYFQTSIRADKLFTFKRWQLETYVDLINVVRGVNPELESYAYDYSESAYVRGLPFIPNLGLEARFWL
jgi:hypothetical protein